MPAALATITFRLRPETKAALEEACRLGPYRLTATAIVERGIELALAELRAARQAMAKAPGSDAS